MLPRMRKRAWGLLLAFGISTIGLPVVHQVQHARWAATDKPVTVAWQQLAERYRVPDPCSLYASLHSLAPVGCSVGVKQPWWVDLPIRSPLSPALPTLRHQSIRAPPAWG
ncbi:hypothetical protein [Rhodothermus bifroesti]|uniref:Uncharacterized protein n=1 Tax=Rhodothermus marinus TaxID=29549 RepID=A0A7V2B2V8_RHOMR|nr:hypothetical protein [Rhodothermus bifroesti]GBD02459.1 hypothetical protein HRbin18_02201 [bacterium HR18]